MRRPATPQISGGLAHQTRFVFLVTSKNGRETIIERLQRDTDGFTLAEQEIKPIARGLANASVKLSGIFESDKAVGIRGAAGHGGGRKMRKIVKCLWFGHVNSGRRTHWCQQPSTEDIMGPALNF